MRKRAQTIVQVAARRSSHDGNKLGLELVALALGTRKVDFSKVIKMIDDMVALLKKEQADDDGKKEYCEVQIDSVEDSKKELEHAIGDLKVSIEEMTSGIAALADEIKALEDGIVALDKSVAEATEQRKEENADYTELISSNSAA